jgi:energy-converting hydrogenase Eha subunit B
MKQITFILLSFFLALFQVASGQVGASGKNFTVNGTLQDALSGEYLIGAVVACPELNKGCATNLYGFYSLTLPEGKHVIRFSLIGYESQEITIELNQDTRYDRFLNAQQLVTGEITIEGSKNPSRFTG